MAEQNFSAALATWKGASCGRIWPLRGETVLD